MVLHGERDVVCVGGFQSRVASSIVAAIVLSRGQQILVTASDEAFKFRDIWKQYRLQFVYMFLVMPQPIP